MYKCAWLVFIIIISFCSCENEKYGLIENIMYNSGKFNTLLNNTKKYKIQIIYTQIDRDAKNRVNFKTYKFRVGSKYFYPASSIKLPMAALALEKVNDQNIHGFTPFSEVAIDSANTGQTRVLADSTSRSGKPSIAHYIKKMLLVSNNDAFNRLYEFVGQKEANDRMISKGYEGVRFTHRLSLPLTVEQNKHTNPMKFYTSDSLVYKQEPVYNSNEIKSRSAITLGEKFKDDDGNTVPKPMDFTYKNAIELTSLHKVLLTIMFPENFDTSQRFNLKQEDYQFLYKNMSMYPRESHFPQYGVNIPDGISKFLLYGGTENHIDESIRIYNKIGGAYGFLIDMAYIVDFEKRIEFVLGAVIYVNENEILNDGIYEYDSIGLPFMRDLGQVFYNYEVSRYRANPPDLSKYNWKTWKK